jgi:hypothetical protein
LTLHFYLAFLQLEEHVVIKDRQDQQVHKDQQVLLLQQVQQVQQVLLVQLVQQDHKVLLVQLDHKV